MENEDNSNNVNNTYFFDSNGHIQEENSDHNDEITGSGEKLENDLPISNDSISIVSKLHSKIGEGLNISPNQNMNGDIDNNEDIESDNPQDIENNEMSDMENMDNNEMGNLDQDGEEEGSLEENPNGMPSPHQMQMMPHQPLNFDVRPGTLYPYFAMPQMPNQLGSPLPSFFPVLGVPIQGHHLPMHPVPHHSQISRNPPSPDSTLVPGGGDNKYVDITPFLALPQAEAAKKLNIPTSTLSKRWKEAVRGRKWPYRSVCKLDKEIMTLLHNIPHDMDYNDQLPQDIEKDLAELLSRRQEELKPVVIRL